MGGELDGFYGDLSKSYEQGGAQQAERFLLDVRTQAGNRQPPDREKLIAACNELGSLYRGTGRYAQSIAAFQEAQKLAADLTGEVSGEYATVLNNMAGTYRLAGDIRQAIALFQRSMEIYRAAGQQESYAYASVLNNISLAYRDAGDPAQAIGFLEKALAMIEREPDRQAEIAVTYNNLTALYYTAGRRDEAMRCLNRALQECEKCAYGECVHYAEILNSLAGFLFSEGEYERALILYRKSAAYTRSLHGETADYGATCQNLYWVYEKLGRRKDAAAALAAAQAAFEKALGPTHERTLLVRDDLNRLLRESGGNAET